MGQRTEGARERCANHVWPLGQPVWEAVGPTASPTGRGTRGLMATLASLAHSHVLQPYLGHPNSDFESVFGL